MSSSDMHEWYIKKCVYIGNPNQTRHLGDHHRRIKTPEYERHTLLKLLRGESVVTESPATLRSGDLSSDLNMNTPRGPGSRRNLVTEGPSMYRIVRRL